MAGQRDGQGDGRVPFARKYSQPYAPVHMPYGKAAPFLFNDAPRLTVAQLEAGWPWLTGVCAGL